MLRSLSSTEAYFLPSVSGVVEGDLKEGKHSKFGERRSEVRRRSMWFRSGETTSGVSLT